MKKPIFSVPVYIVILYLVVSLISCNKENPITPVIPIEPIDTVEYFNWTIDTFAYPIAGILPIDTNKYYMTSESLPYLALYIDGVKKNIDLGAPYFRGGFIRAKSESKIFVGGGLYGTYDTRAQLRIVENGKVTSYSVPDDSTWGIGYMLIDNDDNLWFGTSKNLIYKFKDGIFKKYELEKGLYNPAFYLDNTNQLYIFCIDHESPPSRYFIKKIVNDTIISVSEEILITYGQKLTPFGGICLNNDLMLSSLHTFYWFSNEKWNPIYTNNDLVFVQALNGFSKNFLFCFLNRYFVNDVYLGSILENNKLHYERNLKLRFCENPHIPILLNDKVVFIPVAGDFFNRLFIGVKKTFKKNN